MTKEARKCATKDEVFLGRYCQRILLQMTTQRMNCSEYVGRNYESSKQGAKDEVFLVGMDEGGSSRHAASDATAIIYWI